MQVSKISWREILKKQIPNVQIDFEESPIHYKQVMELAKLGYKIPQTLIDYKDDEIKEDENNPFFTDDFIQHIKEDYLVEVKLNIPKKYLEFMKNKKLNLSEMLNALIEKHMQIKY